MHIAAPVLLILGGYILGLIFHAFSRHKGLGFFTLIAGIVLIILGLAGYSFTLPSGVKVNSPHPSATSTPSPHKT